MDIKKCAVDHAGNVCQERLQNLAEGRSLGGKIAVVITFKSERSAERKVYGIYKN